MSDRILKGLDFEYYHRLFTKIAGDGYGLAVCTREGVPLWISAELGSERMAEALNSFQHNNGLIPAAEVIEDKYVNLNEMGTLFCHPIRLTNDEPVGWLAALTTESGTGQADQRTEEVMDALRDITPGVRREYELNSELETMTEELSARYEELNLVYDMGNLCKNYGLKDEIFNQMVKLCATYMNVDMVFFVRPEKKQVFYTLNSHSEKIDIHFLLEKIEGRIYPFVATSKECVIISEETDSRRDLIFSGLPYRVIVVPILIKKQVMAILLMLRHKEKTGFSASDRNLIEVMAGQASILFQNQYMYSEAQIFTEQMAATLIEAIEAKDPNTRGHSDRVNSFSVEIGQLMGLSEANLRILYWASLLHDLGKLGIPDAVLTKPGRLTEDEYAIIKMHPERSYVILKDVNRLKEALPGIRHHHERYDGRGYPHELKGKEIPLHARIISVADVYDAMTSTRPYRPARTHQEAMNEIRKAAGTQLDPKIVDVWTQVVNRRQDFFQARNATTRMKSD